MQVLPHAQLQSHESGCVCNSHTCYALHTCYSAQASLWWQRQALTLTPTPPFSFLDYLLGKVSFKLGASRTLMHCQPMAHHLGVASQAAISFPYYLHFPLLDFVGLWTIRVRSARGFYINLNFWAQMWLSARLILVVCLNKGISQRGYRCHFQINFTPSAVQQSFSSILPNKHTPNRDHHT